MRFLTPTSTRMRMSSWTGSWMKFTSSWSKQENRVLCKIFSVANFSQLSRVSAVKQKVKGASNSTFCRLTSRKIRVWTTVSIDSVSKSFWTRRTSFNATNVWRSKLERKRSGFRQVPSYWWYTWKGSNSMRLPTSTKSLSTGFLTRMSYELKL